MKKIFKKQLQCSHSLQSLLINLPILSILVIVLIMELAFFETFNSLVLGIGALGLVVPAFLLNRSFSMRETEDSILDQLRMASVLKISQRRTETLQELLDFSLNEAISLSQSKFGYLYYYLEESEEFVLHAWSSGVMQECAIKDKSTTYKLVNTGFWGEAVRQRKPFIINDFKAPHPLKKGYPHGHVELSRFMTVPVFKDGRIVAVVGLANKESPYTSYDVEQLEILMGFTWEIAERKRVEEEIRRIAYYDSLTSLPNRTHLIERLNQVTSSGSLGNPRGAVIIIDLDDLKTINDVFGHSAGDDVIRAAAGYLTEAVGKFAYLSRIGGDEFIVLLPEESDRVRVARTAEKIASALNREYDLNGSHFHMSISIGIALYPEDGETAEEILKSADSALNNAKSGGKSCYRFYEKAMREELHEKMILTRSLRYALERGELILHYQPQMTVSGVLKGFEALIRWNSTEHGLVPPARFIPLAEASGLILSIGEWVVREACLFARSLADLGKTGLYVAVNISPHQIAAQNFVATVQSAVSDAGIEPTQLELEITENVLLHSMDDTIQKLDQLRSMGVLLSLDDFGTGYSSLTYLRRLPVGTVKIDKTFIDRIEEDLAQAAIVVSIFEMAHVLGMKVVAEGVETKKQLECLARSQCDLVQGYIFSRALPADKAILFAFKAASGNPETFEAEVLVS